MVLLQSRAILPVVPALQRWGNILHLLGRVDNDGIDTVQFEVLCKMLLSSMVIGFEVGNRRSGSSSSSSRSHPEHTPENYSQ